MQLSKKLKLFAEVLFLSSLKKKMTFIGNVFMNL